MALRGLGLLPVAVAFHDLVASINTVGDGDERVLILKGSRGGFARGDLLAWSSPARANATHVARLKHFDGEIAITPPKDPRSFPRLCVVPPGNCWLEEEAEESDDARRRHDSRTAGPIPCGLVVGRVAAVVWPPGKARWLG